MTRVKRGTTQHARKKRLLKQTKGYMWRRKSTYRAAKEAVLHAWTHQFSDRKKKKRTMRRTWQVKINAAARENGISYSKLVPRLKAANIHLDRKVLSDIAANHPEVFKQILSAAQ
ncbi:MAG TPA: 50S ribosomal protein L20 [Candidatus Paceibacterota bacterium]|nr:50S ribosomal protein L20 [Candidatus Paceibacterota bacterium]